FHAGNVHGVQLFHIPEHFGKLRLELGHLFVTQVQPGQPGRVSNVKIGIHGRTRKSGTGAGRKQILPQKAAEKPPYFSTNRLLAHGYSPEGGSKRRALVMPISTCPSAKRPLTHPPCRPAYVSHCSS